MTSGRPTLEDEDGNLWILQMLQEYVQKSQGRR